MLDSGSRSIVARVVFAACLGGFAALFVLAAKRWTVDTIPIDEYRAAIMRYAPLVPGIAIIVGLCVPVHVLLREPSQKRQLLYAAALGIGAAVVTFVACCLAVEFGLLMSGSGRGDLGSPAMLVMTMIWLFMLFMTVGGLLFAIPATPFGALAGVACVLILRAGVRLSARARRD